MIKIFLDSQYKETVTDIFKKITNKVSHHKSRIRSLTTDENNTIVGENITDEVITTFLMSENFYKYRIEFNSKDDEKKVFSYDFLKPEYRHKIISKMNVHVCPYCNMNYTITYLDEAEQTTADLDHFYAKSSKPEFALCLYNFIPSCVMCNRNFKGQNSQNIDKYIFPHENEFGGNCTFGIENLEECILGNVSPSISLKYADSDESINEKIENSVELFKIEKVYNSEVVKHYARDLINKHSKYSDSQREELKNILDSQEDLEYLIWGEICDVKDRQRNSLGKFKSEIINILKEK